MSDLIDDQKREIERLHLQTALLLEWHCNLLEMSKNISDENARLRGRLTTMAAENKLSIGETI